MATSQLAKRRRALTKFWLNARWPITIGAVVLLLAAGGFVGYGKLQSVQEKDQKRALQVSAEDLDKQVSSAVVKTRKRLRAAVKDSELIELLAAGDARKIKAKEEQLAAEFDEVISVSLLPMGYDQVDRSVSPPIGYAVLELLKESVERGKVPKAEVQLFGNENQHIALLMQVKDADGNLAGHLRWALGLVVLKKTVMGVAPPSGYTELVQPLSKGKPLVLASLGDKASRQGSPVFTTKVSNTSWRVSFWTKQAAPSSGSSGGLLMPVVGVAAASAVLAAGFVMWRKRKPGAAVVKKEPPAVVAKAVKATADGGTAKEEVDPLDIGPPPLPEVEETDASGAPVAAASASAEGGEGQESEQLSPEIFRAYDIRGVVGESLTANTVRAIGRAVGSEAYERQQQTVVVGCDGRLSGPELVEALVEGLRSTGRDVIDIGRVPTPVLYFATHYLNTGSGVIVTGSHNPPEYNGLKIMLGGDTLFGDAIQGLRQRIESDDLMSGEGSLQTMDVLPEYIRRVTEDVPVALGNAYKVVVDCGNGIAGDVAPKLIRALGHDVIELFCEVDGNFPNHHPDPSKPENLEDLVSAIKENEADIGFAFDGDGDRLGVVDKNGKVIWPDLQMMLYARDIISRNPGAQIVFDVKCTSRLPKVIKKLGGEPLMWKTGHSFIKSKMKETGALLAGEMSGHIFFKERWYGFDDAMYASARMLELLLGFKQAPTEVFAKLPTGVATPELNVPMSEGAHLEFMQRLLESPQFENATVTTIDGLRVDYKDSWGLVRASNTTPSLVLRFEADNGEALTRIQEEFRGLLLGQDSDLSLPF